MSETLSMGFDESPEERVAHIHDVKITTEHEIGDALLTALGVDPEDEDMKRLICQEIPNVADYIREPILDAVNIEREASEESDED